jgi:hypothetical protein
MKKSVVVGVALCALALALLTTGPKSNVIYTKGKGKMKQASLAHKKQAKLNQRYKIDTGFQWSERLISEFGRRYKLADSDANLKAQVLEISKKRQGFEYLSAEYNSLRFTQNMV